MASKPENVPPPLTMQLVSSSMGLKIPGTPIGISVASSAYIKFKFGLLEPLYAIGSGFDVGDKSNNLTAVATNEFRIVHAKEIQIRLWNMDNLLADLELSGTIIANFGKVDISLTVYDEKNQPLIQAKEIECPASGIMVGGAKLRGKLILMNKPQMIAGTKSSENSRQA